MNTLLALAALLSLGVPRAAGGDWEEGARAFALVLEAAGSRDSAPLSAGRAADGSLSLTGGDCETLGRQAAALSDWKRRLGEAPGAPAACLCGGSGCSLGVGPVAPDLVNEFHGARARRWGPNCWNAALLSAKILARPRFTSPEEMTFWLESPLCRRLGAGEAPRPGDLVAIRDRAGQEVHGFVYLSPELSFSKNLVSPAERYALQSPEAVYAVFPVPDGCRAPGSPAGCPARSDHFRCSTREGHARATGETPSAEYLDAEAAVAAAEKTVSHLAFNWKADPAFRGGADLVLAASREALLPVRELARGRSGLAWRALSLRIDAILHQIELI